MPAAPGRESRHCGVTRRADNGGMSFSVEAIERATLAAVPPDTLEEQPGWLLPLDAGTVGRALPGVGVRVRDDQGREPGAGGIGGIEVRGPSIFAGYWQMPEKTREDFTEDGWFRTGDVGALDAEGVLTLVGRSKDLVISGGFNVYPAEVEGRINELPGVAESAVVGVPHPDFCEAVVAVVVPRPGAAPEPAAIIAALRDTIAHFKVPKHVRLADALPRNAMGKVQKKLLREEMAGLFG